MTRLQLTLSAIVGTVLLCLAAWLGYVNGSARAPVAEVTAPAPAVVQPDGSVVAQRVPDLAPSPPPHALPRGAKEERRMRVTVQPTATPPPGQPPLPVSVDLSLVRDGGGRRVVASSPDGRVIDALDVPIDPAPMPPPERPWAVGLSYSTDKSAGVWVERDFARIRAGLDLQRREDGNVVATARLGFVF
ncbi:hypothetical protein ACTSKR_07760 [Chitinibacteraceae bacterium HSL-7]